MGDEMNIYTRNGDQGSTRLPGGEEVPKSDVRIRLLGALDELSAIIGTIRAESSGQEAMDMKELQEKLYLLMADIADGSFSRLDAESTKWLEQCIDSSMNGLPPQKGFVKPGEDKASARLHLARTVARRAETLFIEAVELLPAAGSARSFLNRISDYLYARALYTEFEQKVIGLLTRELDKNGFSAVASMISSEAKITKLGLQEAKQLLEAVERKAEEIGLAAVMAVADASGNIIAMHFMDGAYPISYDVATKKAYTAAAIRMSTAKLSELAQPGCEFYGIQNSNDRIIVFGGGVPLSISGRVVGGLGVSGGSVEQDTALAEYGAELFHKGNFGREEDSFES